MLEVLVWMSKVESALARSLGHNSASSSSETARRLKKVSRRKRALARSMISAASRIRAGSIRAPLLAGLKSLRDDIDDSLSFLTAAIESGLDGAELGEALAVHECLKWNNVILTLGGPVRDSFPEGVPMLVAAQRHKRAVESFLELGGLPQGLFRLRAADPVWRERLLLIGEFGPALRQGFRGESLVEAASGKDAIERLRERYYGAVLADEDLPDFKASELCRKASRIFPGIEDRFLFLYGGLEKKGKSPGPGKGIRRLHKSASKEKILEEVGLILDR